MSFSVSGLRVVIPRLQGCRDLGGMVVGLFLG